MAIDDQLAKVLREARVWIDQSTIQLFFCAPDGRPRAHGSGTLFRMADLHFVITAAHVLDWTQAGEGGLVVVNAGGSMTELAGDVARWNGPDVAVYRLDALSATAITHKRFLTRSDVRRGPDTRSQMLAFFGYPVEWTRALSPASITSKPIYHATSEYDAPSVLLSGYDRIRDLLLLNEDAVDMQGEDVTLPHLRGISGCGVWSVADRDRGIQDWTPEQIRLVAVETGVYSSPRNLVKAARWEAVLSLMGKHWPELLPAMSLLAFEG